MCTRIFLLLFCVHQILFLFSARGLFIVEQMLPHKIYTWNNFVFPYVPISFVSHIRTNETLVGGSFITYESKYGGTFFSFHLHSHCGMPLKFKFRANKCQQQYFKVDFQME